MRGLWRGRRGTEAAIGTQAAGDRFVLISADSLALVDLPGAAAGTEVWVLAEGAGDVEGAAEAMAGISGFSVVPPAPVHLAAVAMDDGSWEVRWVRRSRAGWRWIDGIDAALGEESERYRVTITPGGGPERSLDTDVPVVTLAAEERAPGAQVTVRQAGSHGLSAPSVIVLPPLD